MRRTLGLSVSLIPLSLAIAVSSGWAVHAQTAAAPAPDVAGKEAANAVQDVVVVAARSAQRADQVTAAATVLTLSQIRSDQELAVSDLLQRTPGVEVSRNGGPGQTTSVRIRGAETDQTVVLIDGVQINDPSSPGGGFNFGDLLKGDISRIEVLRGPQSTLYGSQAIGGVVNIVTADPTRPFQGDVQIEGGTYGTGYAKAAAGGRDGAWTWRIAGSAYTTSGISAFDKAFGGEEKDGYRNEAVSARLGYQATPDVSVDLRALYVNSRADFDGFSNPTFSFGDDPEYGTVREVVGYAGLNFGLLDDRLKNRVAVQYTSTERNLYDPTDAPVTKTFDGRGANTRVEYQGIYTFAPGWLGTFGAQSERSTISVVTPAYDDPASPAYFPPGSPPTTGHATINSGYGHLQAEVIKGLTLTAGVRYDDHSTFGGHTTGQTGAAWSLNDGSTILRASYGQGFKAPTLYQLFSEYGTPTLRPEQANGGDVGIEQRFWHGLVDVEAAYFERTTHNMIGFASSPCTAIQLFGCYSNVQRAEAKGVELAGAVHPMLGLDLTANYTYTDARDRSPGSVTDGNALPRRPQDSANAGVTYVWPCKLTTGVALRYAGASFDNAANTVRLKSYTLVDLRASYPVGHGLEVYGRVENLADKAYETAYQYGSLGRAGYLGLRAVF